MYTCTPTQVSQPTTIILPWETIKGHNYNFMVCEVIARQQTTIIAISRHTHASYIPIEIQFRLTCSCYSSIMDAWSAIKSTMSYIVTGIGCVNPIFMTDRLGNLHWLGNGSNTDVIVLR